jgi:hypothetical protein
MSNFALLFFFITFLSWWTLNLIFERLFNMKPIVLSTENILKKDHELNQIQGIDSNLLLRNSRAIGANEKYRIKTRASLSFTKCIASLVLTAITFYSAVHYQSFHQYWGFFYDLDANLNEDKSIKAAAATMLSWYLFETIYISQYFTLRWSELVHHWLTSIAAVAVLMGNFLPAAILYGAFLVAFVWPVSLITGFKLQYSHKYPRFTQRAYKVVYYYFLLMIFCCISLQILLLINGINKGLCSVSYVIFIIFCCITWCYDDLQAAKKIKEHSNYNYEYLDFKKIEN